MRVPAKQFTYSYRAGPVDTKAELQAAQEGNCRFAIQVYFYELHNVWLAKDEIYLPGGYQSLGRFVYQEESIAWDTVQPGDIVYAQRLRNRAGAPIDQSLSFYQQNKDEWRYHLHSAIYAGSTNGTSFIWHATSVANGTAFWTLAEFHYYQAISIKRVLD